VAQTIADVVSQVQSIAEVYGLRVGADGPLPLRQLVQAIAASVQRVFGRAVAIAEQAHPGSEWTLPEAKAIPLALTLNELLTNAIKHSAASAQGGYESVTVRLNWSDDGARLAIANRARLPEGFCLEQGGAGVSGLALVRSLLPRRGATLSIEQQGEWVLASLDLVAPAIVRCVVGHGYEPIADNGGRQNQAKAQRG
jgi:two-component sensor histidine kinase